MLIITASVLSAAEPKIIIYSAPWCGFCVKLEKYLTEQNVKFIKINTDKSPAAKQEARRKSGRGGIPVLDWDGEIIAGFAEEQKEEIDRLIAGGKPVRGVFVLKGRPRQSQTPQQAQIDYFLSQTRNLNNFFAVAQQHIDDINSADIMEKLYCAHMARVIYESTFTEQFIKRVEKTGNNGADNGEIIETAKVFAAKRYLDTFKAYKTARTKDIQASVAAQNAVKFAIVHPDGQGSDENTRPLNPKEQSYFLKLWACAALNPMSNNKIQPPYSVGLNTRKDAIADKAARVLDEMAEIQQNPGDIEEPNSLPGAE